jgi:hypothetical protein
MQSLQEGLECAKRKNPSRLKNSDVEKEEGRWNRRRRSGTTTYIEFYLNLDGSLRITYKWKSRLPD